MELIHDNPELPEETRQKYAGIALRKANRMLSLVEELFEVTRFKIGRIELERTNISAEMLILQLTEELMPLLRRKNIEISVDNQGVFDIFVDPDKMARALDNILVNAANYTPEGEKIMVTLDKYADRSRIRIANTGMDIPQEKPVSYTHLITVIAMLIAIDEQSVIFQIVSFAWAGFGATFGPLMLFSLFWKRINRQGAIAGMISGGVMVFVWKLLILSLIHIFCAVWRAKSKLSILSAVYCRPF